MFKYLFLLVWAFSLFSTPGFCEQRFFGTYKGFLRHPSLKRDQIAKLDFIVDRKSGNTLEISAVLKLYFGSENSHEYVSYFFDSVYYNLGTSRLVFDQADQGLSIIVSRFTGRYLEGKVRTPDLGDEEATLLVSQDQDIKPLFPTIHNLEGTYLGKDSVLELQTFRSTQEYTDSGSPFRENEIRGRLARENPDLGGLINDNVFSAGSYDFFKEKLELTGSLETLSCSVTESGLTCDGEKFSRPKAKPAITRRNILNLAPSKISSESNETKAQFKGLSGEYRGFVYHEMLNQYQTAHLSIRGFNTGAEGLKYSATASLYFGEGKKSIYYKFDPRDYNMNSPLIVFRRAGVDAIIQVTSRNDQTITGIWFSRIFGRVGSFILQKDVPPNLPKDSTELLFPAEKMQSPDWQLQLQAVSRGKTGKVPNPFAPLSFNGLVWDKDRIVLPKSSISGGGFDFYTGRMHLPFNRPEDELFMIGDLGTDGTLGLTFHLSNRYGALYRRNHATFSLPKKQLGGKNL